jgi:MFS transporter, putative metabolite:H+ symporter
MLSQISLLFLCYSQVTYDFAHTLSVHISLYKTYSLMRVSVLESGLFAQISTTHHSHRGDLRMLIRPRDRLFKYLRCCAVGVPNWMVLGVLITFSPELSREMGIQGTATGSAKASTAVFWMYLGLSAGDALYGLLSQYFKTRKKVLFSATTAALLMTFAYLFQRRPSAAGFYCAVFFLGLINGYVLYIT